MTTKSKPAYEMAITLSITVERDNVAPPDFRWLAWRGDYDLGVPSGSGATPLEAVEDLLPKLRELEVD